MIAAALIAAAFTTVPLAVNEPLTTRPLRTTKLKLLEDILLVPFPQNYFIYTVIADLVNFTVTLFDTGVYLRFKVPADMAALNIPIAAFVVMVAYSVN